MPNISRWLDVLTEADPTFHEEPMLSTSLPTPSLSVMNQHGPRASSPSDRLHDCLAQASLRRIEAKEYVFADGDPARLIYRIETGAVSLFKILPDGRRQILGFAYPGDFIGLGCQGEHIMNAQAIKPTRVRSMPASALYQLAVQDPRLSFKLYQTVASDLAATRDLLMTTGHRSARERVAAFLLALSQRNERNGVPAEMIELPMTRADIADFLGLTIETVSRTLTKLKISGLIDLPQSACVRLRDIEALQALAEGADC
jgi:CRP/FNR family transcriptional regulator